MVSENRFARGEASRIVSAEQYGDQAYIDFQQSGAPKLVRKMVIDLSTARGKGNPLQVTFAFKSVYVYTATDTASEISLYLATQDDAIEYDSVPLQLKDVFNFDRPIKGAFLTNEAQSGKSITLFFILNGQFFTGSTINEISSSVEGNSFTNETDVTVTTTPAILLAQDLNRKVANFYLNAPIYVAASAASSIWFPWAAGYNVHKNTGALYAKTLAGNATVNILTES